MTKLDRDQLDASGRKLPVNVCPTCFYELDCATNTTGSRRPRPGDFSVCMKCGEIMVFDESLRFKVPSVSALLELRQLPVEWSLVTTAQRLIREHRWIK